MPYRRLARASFAAVMLSAGAAAFTLPSPARAVTIPVAVDVDIVEGGVWVTYSNGCVESRAWQVPNREIDNRWYQLHGNPPCVAGRLRSDADNLFHFPRVIRAASLLSEREQAVALVPTDGGEGYWLVTSAGRVMTGGSARSLGDLAAVELNTPVVAAAPTESGEGYYMLSADGGVFSFGDARFYGSVQGLVDSHVGLGALAVNHLTAPVVTLATTPAGYWLVAADGAVFPFGDAAYYGSVQDSINTGNQLSGVTRDWVLTPSVATGAQLARDVLSEPVIGVVPSGKGAGYQMVAADGGIFNFGVSQFHGSLSGRSRSPAVASDVTDSRSGYVILTAEGSAYRFGVVGRQLDNVGNPPTTLTPTALPASECRPEGEQGFPLPWYAAPPIGALDVGVLFVEFDDFRADRRLWPKDALIEQLETAERYIEDMSYGQLDVVIHATYDWISAGPLLSAYREYRTVGAHSLGTRALWQEILRRASRSFDVSNAGIGYDAIMVVFPPSWFGGGLAQIDLLTTASGITAGTIAWTNTFGPREERIDFHHTWWDTAAHEIMHLPGLDDLYAYDPSLRTMPKGFRSTEFGLMGFTTYWPAREQSGWSRGQVALASGRTFHDDYYTFSHQEAREMLAWHRWRMGWLRANQVACLGFGKATVDLAPISDPTQGLAAAIVKLSDSQFLVLEARRRVGYDADQRGTFSGGGTYYYRVLDSEGVLAYVVDTTVGSGDLPVSVFADGVELDRDEDWVIGAGRSHWRRFGDGTLLRLNVSEGPHGTSRVEIVTNS